MNQQIETIVILGGGTAGWMTAAALARFKHDSETNIVLIESDAIGTIGVGEATIPHIRAFNEMLGIDEREFIQRTGATFKLGINFSGWGSASSNYFHPFGDHGFSIDSIHFHHHWIHAKAQTEIPPFDKYSYVNVLAESGRFAYPSADTRSIESTYSYAYHLDAGLYARFLREYSEKKGVKRVEGFVESAIRSKENGYIESLKLRDGQKIKADFFVDCSGFRSLLIGGELGVEFDSWKEWLPCNRAVAIPCEAVADPLPYTKSTAEAAGWRWQIPLQHRLGNGYVYSCDYISDQEAIDCLVGNLPGTPLADPNYIRFEAGMRKKSWEKNCVAIGLSSGFLEPLESTSIYLIQIGIYKLLELFPDKNFSILDSTEYNRLVNDEYQKIRDFLILHYFVNQRKEDFWRYCAAMRIPESLSEKMEIFKTSAQVVSYETGLFQYPSWLAVYLGQGYIPERVDPRMSFAIGTVDRLRNMKKYIDVVVSAKAGHQATLDSLKIGHRHGGLARMSLYGGTNE